MGLSLPKDLKGLIGSVPASAPPAVASPGSPPPAPASPTPSPQRPEAAGRCELLRGFGTPAPPRLPRRRGAASQRRDHGVFLGDTSRGDDPRGNNPGGNLARLGGTSPLLGTYNLRAHALGPRPPAALARAAAAAAAPQARLGAQRP